MLCEIEAPHQCSLEYLSTWIDCFLCCMANLVYRLGTQQRYRYFLHSCIVLLFQLGVLVLFSFREIDELIRGAVYNNLQFWRFLLRRRRRWIICDLKCTDVAYTHHCCPTLVILELFYTRPEVFFGETNAQNLVHQGYFVIMKSVKRSLQSIHDEL